MTQTTRIRAVLFDLDGTLLDTLEDLAESMNAVLSRRGHPVHPLNAYRYFVGQGIFELCRAALPGDQRDETKVAAAVTEMRREYGRRWADKTAPYDGVLEMLEAVAVRGLPMVVLSNKPHDFTIKAVERFLPEVPFRNVLGVGDDVPPKPDPSAALRLAGELGVEPAEMLYLGDTATDMRTAVSAGMFPVGVSWGFRPAEELWEHGAQRLIERPMDLLDIIPERARPTRRS